MKTYIDMEKVEKLIEQSSEKAVLGTIAKCDNCGASAVVGNFVLWSDAPDQGLEIKHFLGCPWCRSDKIYIEDLGKIFKEVI